MTISEQVIAQVKKIPIDAFLQDQGFVPVKAKGCELLYFSPLREESTPSFWVNTERNVFKDFGVREFRGDIITLIREMKGFNFSKAIHYLCDYKIQFDHSPASFSFSGQIIPTANKSSFELQNIRPLENKALVGYLRDKRGIPFLIASKYLQECYFRLNGKNQFALCFENDLKGFELRNQYLKLSTAPKAITTIKGQHRMSALIFEGFMDFLSYIVWKGHIPACDVIVCNSLVNLTGVLPSLKKYQVLSTYFDNDMAGMEGVELIKASGVRVSDCRGIYSPYKDVNDYLLKQVLK